MNKLKTWFYKAPMKHSLWAAIIGVLIVYFMWQQFKGMLLVIAIPLLIMFPPAGVAVLVYVLYRGLAEKRAKDRETAAQDKLRADAAKVWEEYGDGSAL